MVVYFRGPSARITDTWYVAYRPYSQKVAIRDISYAFGVERGTANPTPLLVGSSSTGAVLAVVAWFEWFDFTRPAWAGAGLLMVVAASLTARACLNDQGRSFELWAVVYGVHVLLLDTTEREEFEQVRRALVRALQAATDS
jgi:hypothetical protein